ncbi:MAG TPA: hypothetical protein VMN78_13545 [Longimicrobiales bacterium]|nr:hypothetical protein [Longimicrobiales bacterium]
MTRSMAVGAALCCAVALAACDSSTEPADTTTFDGMLPPEIAGTRLDITEIDGDGLVDSADESWSSALAAMGVVPSDLKLAIGLPQDSTVDLQIGAFRVSGLEWTTRLQAFAGEMEGATGGLVDFERRDVGGRSVLRATHGDHPDGTRSYYYPAGDVLFFIGSASESIAADALHALPAGAGVPGTAAAPAAGRAPDASAAAAPTVTTPARAAAASLMQPVYVHLGAPILPIVPACVGWPVSPHQVIQVQAMVSGEAGVFPYQVMISALTPFGEITPSISVGFAHLFRYASRQFGLGTADQLHLIGTVGGGESPAQQMWPLRVQHCLNGRWLDGERILRIRQTFQATTATIETGTLTCGEAGQAFSGDLNTGAAINTLRGTDLKVCNPPACVDAGHLEKTELASYDGSVSDDGASIDIVWEQQLFDLEYDDEGNLTSCPRTDIAQLSFSITRLDWGPDTPF